MEDDLFKSTENLTRGQFIVMIMKAYGIEPNEDVAENFADAGNTYYTSYLAEAKRMGISSGIGQNLFAPEKAITRQVMITILYNMLDSENKIPDSNSNENLGSFGDYASVAPYAEEAMKFMVNSGVVSGSNGMRLPYSKTTRGEMAQVLYNLLSK